MFLIRYPMSHATVAFLAVALAFAVTGQWFPLLGFGIYAMREYRDWEKSHKDPNKRRFDKRGFWYPTVPMLGWQIALWVSGYHDIGAGLKWLNWIVYMAVAGTPGDL